MANRVSTFLFRCMLNHMNLVLVMCGIQLYVTYEDIRTNGKQVYDFIGDTCNGIEDKLTSAIMAIENISTLTNKATLMFVNATIDKLVTILSDLIQFVGESIIFFIDSFKSKYQCVFSSMVEAVVFFLRDYAAAVDAAIKGTVSVTNDAVNGLARIFAGRSDNVVNLSTNLNLKSFIMNSIPSDPVSFLKDDLYSRMMIPFNEGSKWIQTIGANAQVNGTLFPPLQIPKPDICSKMDLSFIREHTNMTMNVLVFLLCLGALVFVSNTAFRCWIFLRSDDKTQIMVEETFNEDSNSNIVTRMITDGMAKRFSPNILVQRKMKLFLVNAMYTPSLFCFYFGMVNILAAVLQKSALFYFQDRGIEMIERMPHLQVPPEFNEKIERFLQDVNKLSIDMESGINDKIITPVNNALTLANTTVVDSINKGVDFMQTELHTNVLGPYVPSMVDCMVTSQVNRYFKIVMRLTNLGYIKVPRISEAVVMAKLDKIEKELSITFDKFRERMIQFFNSRQEKAQSQLISGCCYVLVALMVMAQSLRMALRSF